MRAIKESEIVGKKFGRLTVLGFSTSKRSQRKYLICRCDCGTVKEIGLAHVRGGRIKSCGCLLRETTIKKNTKHGGTGSRLFVIWEAMKKRCNNPNDGSYKHYGGRGIKIADEWNDFEPFRDWSLKNGYAEDLTIDRIDTNGDYSPQNCRWVSRAEQAKNRRNNRTLTINGESKLITEWLKLSPISSTTFYDRVKKGWSPEDALLKPDQRKIKM